MNAGDRCTISPRQKIAKMLYYEYGRTAFFCVIASSIPIPPPRRDQKNTSSAGDAFTRLLEEEFSFDTCSLEEMVQGAWEAMVRLPVPRVFEYINKDQRVQTFLVELVARSHPKGIRV